MMASNLLINIVLLVVTLSIEGTFSELYTAAVVDYFPVRSPASFANDVVLENNRQILKLVEDAKRQNADIVVFPEFALTTYEIAGKDIAHLGNYALDIESSLGKTPCKGFHNNVEKALKELSCGAKENQIYLVVNVLEKGPDENEQNDNADYENESGDTYFSTAIVFDQNGKLISSYRKININKRNDPPLNKGEQIGKFEMNGLTFGLLINDDLLSSNVVNKLFNEKDHVLNLVYLSSWKSEAPFLTALSVQSGFAKMYGVNLLAANMKTDYDFSGGSGIYNNHGGVKTVYDPEQKNSMLVMNATDQSFNEKSELKSVSSKFLKGNFENYVTKEIVADGHDHVEKLCSNERCCEMTYNAVGSSQYTYLLATCSGTHEFNKIEDKYSVCGVFACKNSSSISCGLYHPSHETETNRITFEKFVLKAQTDKQTTEQVFFPSTLTYAFSAMKSADYEVTRSQVDGGVEMRLADGAKQNDLLTFAFVTKGAMLRATSIVRKDGETELDRSSASTLTVFHSLTIVLLALLLLQV